MFKIEPKYFKKENAPLTYHTVFKVFVIIGLATEIFGFLGKLLLIDIAQKIAMTTMNYQLASMIARMANMSWGYIALTSLSAVLYILTIIGLFSMRWRFLSCYFIRYIVLITGEILLFVGNFTSAFDFAVRVICATAWVIPTYIYYMHRRPLFSPYSFTEEDEVKAEEEEKRVEEEKKKEDVVYTYTVDIKKKENKEVVYTYKKEEDDEDEQSN